MTEPPMRDVMNILETTGPRGGTIYVHVLDCGCFKTFRHRVQRATCIACWAVAQIGAPPRMRPRNQILDVLQNIAENIPRGLPADRDDITQKVVMGEVVDALAWTLGGDDDPPPLIAEALARLAKEAS